MSTAVPVVHTASSEGYGNDIATAAYENGRPSYYLPAIKSLVQHASSRVSSSPLKIVEIAAGTGIFTRLLVTYLERSNTAFTLTAVEPVEAMRRKFASLTPNVPIAEGTAADTKLESNSADIIVCAQSFHWFSTSEALKEFHRVLRTNGCLALIWNNRNRNVSWVDVFDDIIDSYYTPSVPRQQTKEFEKIFPLHSDLFEPLQEEHYENGVVQTGDESMLVDRALSISVISMLDEDSKTKAKNRVLDLMHSHPDLIGKTSFSLPYTSDSYWTFAKK